MRAGQIKLALIKGNPLHAIPPATGFPGGAGQGAVHRQLLHPPRRHRPAGRPDPARSRRPGELGGRDPAGRLAATAVYGLMQPVVTPLLTPASSPMCCWQRPPNWAERWLRPSPTNLTWRWSRRRRASGSLRRKARISRHCGSNLLRQGGTFRYGRVTGQGVIAGSPALPLPDPAQPRFAGDEKQFPLHLQVYPSTAFYDGRGAPLPWLQQLPDPMTTVVWDSWIEINPATAARLGISHGDLVEVTSPQGSLRAAGGDLSRHPPRHGGDPPGAGTAGGRTLCQGEGSESPDVAGRKLMERARTGLERHPGAGDPHLGEGGSGDGRPSAGKLPQRPDRDLNRERQFSRNDATPTKC